MAKRKKLLKQSRVLAAGGAMEQALPGMIEKLVEMFYDDSVDEVSGRPLITAKEKTNIFNAFASNVRVRPRIEKKLGIGPGAEAKDSQPLIAVFGGNVTVLRDLPAEQRQEYVLNMLRGKEQALPAPDAE